MDDVVGGTSPITAYFCYQLHIGGFGLSSTWDWNLPVVQVNLSPTGIAIESIARKLMGLTIFSTSWNAKYKEIDRSEVVVTPAWWTFETPNHHAVPFGVRLHLKDPLRSRIVLFADRYEDLVTALVSHGVHVHREPRKLNFYLIGRK